jgi:hypothetical protein
VSQPQRERERWLLVCVQPRCPAGGSEVAEGSPNRVWVGLTSEPTAAASTSPTPTAATKPTTATPSAATTAPTAGEPW